MVGPCVVLWKLLIGAWGGRSRRLWRRNRRVRDGMRPWSVKDTKVTKKNEDCDRHPA